MARRIPASTVRLKLFADYRQLHLLDEGQAPNLGEAWTVKATEDRLAVAAGGLGLGTEQPDTVAVELTVLASEPERAPADHAEASMELRSGRLVVLGCTDYLPDAKRIPVTPGWYRFRASHSGLPKKEKIVVQLWPAPPSDPKVLLRWTPPAPKPVVSKPVRAPKNAKQAAQVARRGDLASALPVLTRLADGGDVAASASLAELLAFQGDWAGFVPRAEALFANPSGPRRQRLHRPDPDLPPRGPRARTPRAHRPCRREGPRGHGLPPRRHAAEGPGAPLGADRRADPRAADRVRPGRRPDRERQALRGPTSGARTARLRPGLELSDRVGGAAAVGRDRLGAHL